MSKRACNLAGITAVAGQSPLREFKQIQRRSPAWISFCRRRVDSDNIQAASFGGGSNYHSSRERGS
jgi:hypothetical protein